MRVLLIENQKSVRDVVKRGLESECFNVDVVSDGESGVAMTHAREYDVVILDNDLPKKSGVDVCQDIRSKGSHVPILILSALTQVQEKINLLNSGADDYITKPFSFEELVARVRALLRRPIQIVTEVFTLGHLGINLLERTVLCGSKEVYLNRKEFDLLEYLVRNRGRVLTRGMIMENVWGTSADPFSNTLETHIFNLRHKVCPEGCRQFIHTVPGRGYKFEDKIV